MRPQYIAHSRWYPGLRFVVLPLDASWGVYRSRLSGLRWWIDLSTGEVCSYLGVAISRADARAEREAA